MADDKSDLDNELNAAEPVAVEPQANPDIDLDESSQQPVIESDISNTPPVIPPPMIEEVHEHDGRRWPTIVVYLLLALIVAFLVVLGARAIYRHYNQPETTPAPAQNNGPSPPTPNEGSSNKSSNTNSNSQSGGTMPNTGPGNTAAIFAAITVAAAGLHYIVSLRRAKNS